MILACYEDCAFPRSMQWRVASINCIWLQKILVCASVWLLVFICSITFTVLSPNPCAEDKPRAEQMFFPLTLCGPAAPTRGIHALPPFWHPMGGIELSACELKVAVNAPLKDNGTGHLPRAHSTGRALFRIISFQK